MEKNLKKDNDNSLLQADLQSLEFLYTAGQNNCITYWQTCCKYKMMQLFAPQWQHILGMMDNVINYFVGNLTSFQP